MKRQTERKLILVLIAACLIFLLFGNSAIQNTVTNGKPEEKRQARAYTPASQFPEKVVYTCRLGSEEIPAVQISEVADESGLVTATVARVAAGTGIEVTALGAVPLWDYKAISARSGEAVIEVVFDPENGRDGDEWILTLSDKNTYFQERVRDCTEIADE